MRETVIQFGEGNFLRGFIDWFLHKMNIQGTYDGKAVIVQPIPNGMCSALEEQNCKYNLYLRGISDGKEICEHTLIESVSRTVNPYESFDEYLALAENPDFRFIISNTTEAGIAFSDTDKFSDTPCISFPGKLTQLLYARFKLKLPGFIIFACELIDNNGTNLKRCVNDYAKLWNLGDDFINWIDSENTFSNTLVDRIVTGFPKDEIKELSKTNGFDDKLTDTAEIFHLWVAEGNFEDELPLKKSGLNMIWTDDVSSYKKRKVRVLNGAHTSIVFPALLCGIETVGECLGDTDINLFLQSCLFKYILPVLGENEENKEFAKAVLERFANPYIKHQLRSIALNSVSKYSVRVLPTAMDYFNKNGDFPKPFALALAALIEFYKTDMPNDDQYCIDYIKTHDIDDIVLNQKLWGDDISKMLPLVKECIDKINSVGIKETVKWASL